VSRPLSQQVVAPVVSQPTVTKPISSSQQTNPTYQSLSNIQPTSVQTPKPVVQTTPMVNVPMSKSAYDSLAPLNLPSKPVFYVDEAKNETANEDKPAQTTSTVANTDDSRQDEKAKLESILFNSMNRVNGMEGSGSGYHHSHQAGAPNRFPGPMLNKNWPRMNNAMFINPANRIPPPNYVCTICKKPGHLKQLCPEAGLMPRPEDRPKFPSGIPRNTLRPAQPGDKFAMLGPEGYVVADIAYEASKTVKKDRPSFLTEEEEAEFQLKQQNQPQLKAAQSESIKIPVELKCPFGDHIIKDAVLIPCCGHFVCCDECIKQKISNDEFIQCPYDKCDQEIGSLSSITPFHETRKKVNDYLNQLKLKSNNSQQQVTAAASAAASSQQSNLTNDPFFDLILSGINTEKPAPAAAVKSYFPKVEAAANSKPIEASIKDSLSPMSNNGTESPLQDKKITSSLEPQNQSLKTSDNVENSDLDDKSKIHSHLQPHLRPGFQPALLPTPPLNPALVPGDINNRNSPQLGLSAQASLLQSNNPSPPSYTVPISKPFESQPFQGAVGNQTRGFVNNNHSNFIPPNQFQPRMRPPLQQHSNIRPNMMPGNAFYPPPMGQQQQQQQRPLGVPSMPLQIQQQPQQPNFLNPNLSQPYMPQRAPFQQQAQQALPFGYSMNHPSPAGAFQPQLNPSHPQMPNQSAPNFMPNNLIGPMSLGAGSNQPPMTTTGPIYPNQFQQQQQQQPQVMANIQPPPSSTLPPSGLAPVTIAHSLPQGLMSEAEFYQYKEQLKKE
jgi:hypothetical protein